jgi:hypothetical protein
MNKGEVKISGDLFMYHLFNLEGFKLTDITFDGQILTLYVESDKIKVNGSEITPIYEGKNGIKLVRIEEKLRCRMCAGYLKLMGRVEQNGKNLGCYYCDVCVQTVLIDDREGEKK